MYSNTKLLISATFLIISLGFSLLWFGLDQNPEEFIDSEPVTTPKVEDSIASDSSTLGFEQERGLVVKVVDGDTFKLENGATVRMVGVDTPETKDPRRPVGCFGKEASSETKSLIEGKVVILQKDVSETDKYKRLLRYVYLPLENGETLFINDYLIREGFATVLTYPPDVKYTEQFLEAQKDAKLNNRGLWGRC